MLGTPTELRRSTPESLGLASKDILEFIEAVEKADLELHSLMLLREGQVIAEGWWAPYKKEYIHLLYSLSKSFTSTAIGFAVQEGRVSIDDSVISYFPAETPSNPSPYLQAMKVRHLLSMSTGHDDGDMTDMRTREDDDWVKGFLAREVQHEPGTHFVYNNGATYMLSAIISKVTGKSTLEYLRPRLFLPLGIDRAIWDCCPKGITIGASALNITTESIARFGQFYLNRGMWNGHRLLADSWFDLATSYQVSNATNDQPDWQQGYGFQFWRCQNNCYRGDGAFGQYCIVIPEFKMVVAITGSVGSMQDVLDLFWKHIHANVKSAALPDNPEANCALNSKLHSLSLHGPDGKAISPVIPRVSGKMFKRTGGESDFQSVIFDFDPQGCTFTVRSDRGDRSIRAGTTQWAHGVTSIEAAGGKRIAAMGSWTSEDTYEIKLRYTESPSGLTIVTRFDGDSVSVVMTKSARFDSLEGPTFEGQLARVPAGMAMSR